MQEVLRVFEGRVTRLEEKAGISPDTTEQIPWYRFQSAHRLTPWRG
jgi:hypothetical protein